MQHLQVVWHSAHHLDLCSSIAFCGLKIAVGLPNKITCQLDGEQEKVGSACSDTYHVHAEGVGVLLQQASCQGAFVANLQNQQA